MMNTDGHIDSQQVIADFYDLEGNFGRFDPETGEIYSKSTGGRPVLEVNSPEWCEKVAEARRKDAAFKRRLANKRRGKPPINSIRIEDLCLLARDLYPEGVPDTPLGRRLIEALARQYVHSPCSKFGGARARIAGVLEREAPWLPDDERDGLLDAITNRSRLPLSAEKLGEWLQLTEERRSRLGITTFRSIDGPSSRKRNSRRQEKFRRKRGKVPRTDYEANSFSQTEPWKDEGFGCRRTWERRRKKEREAFLACLKDPEVADGTVPQVRPVSQVRNDQPLPLPVTDLRQRRTGPRAAAQKARPARRQRSDDQQKKVARCGKVSDFTDVSDCGSGSFPSAFFTGFRQPSATVRAVL